MKEISIIGATSPLGVRLADRLAEQGNKIHATYRSHERVPEPWAQGSSINCVPLDLSGRGDLHGVCKKHMIWLAHLDHGRFNDKEAATNLKPFLRFLDKARNAAVEQITYVSSGGSVYGEAKHLPITEDHPRDPLSSYGRAKKAMEEALIDFGRFTQTRIAIIRPGNIYGFESPTRRVKGIVGAFLNSISESAPFTLIDHGRTVRDFIHVDDICRAIICALESDQREIIWNAGTEVPSRISDLLDLIIRRTGFEMPAIVHHTNYQSDVNTNVLSIERISQESGWKPKIGLEVGVDMVVKNWLNCFSDMAPQIS